MSEFGDVTSVEYDSDCCIFVKEKLNIDVINASITELPFKDNCFDIVCAFDVIEHIDDDKLAVSEIFRVCKLGGFIFVTVPAFMSLWSYHDELNDHRRRYIKAQLINLFSSYNGRVSSGYFCSFLFIPLWFYRKFQNLIKRSNTNSTDFDVFASGISSVLLHKIFNLERKLMKYIKFPFGSSIYLTFRKM